MRLVRESDGAVVVQELAMADSAFKRFRGLMGRAKLVPGEGLWLEPCNSIHMMFMRFPIDVVFLRRTSTGGEVLRVCNRVRPWLGMAWCFGASTALELEAGRASDLHVGAGDQLVLETGEELSP